MKRRAATKYREAWPALTALGMVVVCLLVLAGVSRGYWPYGQKWPAGNIYIYTGPQVDQARTLTDGNPSFGASADAAVLDWNRYLTAVNLVLIHNTNVWGAIRDLNSSIWFADTNLGREWGSGTLAVAWTHWDGDVVNETNIILNNTKTWDSYRGDWRTGVADFRRVLTHELGHALRLDHPDENDQNVASLMNSSTGDLDSLTKDDVWGVTSLYGTGPRWYYIGGTEFEFYTSQGNPLYAAAQWYYHYAYGQYYEWLQINNFGLASYYYYYYQAYHRYFAYYAAGHSSGRALYELHLYLGIASYQYHLVVNGDQGAANYYYSYYLGWAQYYLASYP